MSVFGGPKSQHNQQASEDRTLRQRSAITVRLLWISFVIAATGCASWQPSRMAYRPSFQNPQPDSATWAGNEIAGAARAARGGNTVRGQDSGYGDLLGKQDAGSNQFMRQRMPVTQVQYNTAPPPGYAAPAPYNAPPGPAGPAPAQPLIAPGPQEVMPAPLAQPYVDIDPTMSTPLDVFVEETHTGRFMFGAGVNSDAGVTGQIVIDERNFDITRVPTSFHDFVNGTAFRGAGQGFRLEAMPGTLVQRYLASFTEPYLFNTRISLNLSGFLYDRRYYDWDERRAGGRLSLGYRLTPDLSFSAALRGENVRISDPRVIGVLQPAELTRVLGKSELYSGRFTLTHDTRDVPFSPTMGHLIELSYEQIFGDFDYPRGELDLRRYFIIRERPDGSGRHTLGYNFRLGFSGSNTPLFENYFAGGFSTLRGASSVSAWIHSGSANRSAA